VVKLTIVSMVVFTLAVVMTMAGRGGGNFYVVVFVLSDTPMHEAATTGQFILFMTGISALFVFQKNKLVTWPLAIFLGILMAISALAGGYFSHWFSGFSLKIVFSSLLAVAGGLMLVPLAQPVRQNAAKRSGRQSAFGGNLHSAATGTSSIHG
jgi:uncharacterized membrane protein YfcA